MKKKLSKVNKGAPSGFVISLLVHFAAFSLAGLLVVFTVHQKEEKKFVPPKPVDRPKMKLKKPKVKVKKSAKPKATTRIVTKVQKASMPDIQLPEMSGMTEGLVGDIGGFEIMPDLEEMTVFGAGQTIGNDFVGTFYDLKRSRNGNERAMDVTQYADELTKFCRSGWKPSTLAKFYQSPKKLYTTTFCIPQVRSTFAPFAFDEPDTIACQWAVHYTGQLVHHEDIKFRFWGHGDDVLIVRVDGEIVLDGSWDSDTYGARLIAGKWVSSATKNRQWYLGNNLAWGGDWIELKAGVPKDMEVLIGEQPGGNFVAMLLVEVDGAEYETNPQNQKFLPIFRSAPTTHDVADAIMEHLVPGEADVLRGPVFQDYAPSAPDTNVVADVEPAMPQDEPAEEKPSPFRVWTLKSGQSFEAEYISKIGDKLVLRNAKGKQVRVPVADVSEDDINFIKLSNPPKFDVGIVRSSKSYKIELSTYELDRNNTPPRVLDWEFGAKVRRKGSGDYPFALTLEYFVIGQQYLDADKYRILDHQSANFIPNEMKDGSFEFKGDRVSRLFDWDLNDARRGMRLAESLVLLTDSRGEIIASSSTANWLMDNLDELRKRNVGNYINKDCERVYPTGPRQNGNLY
ncbi:SHD1 domain-containing protein [Pontiella sp.]|uniref:SHD1 domain-containing protein n=1 Tax=Pontiella sp. TaxID=2837462 RepID=UPI003561B87C